MKAQDFLDQLEKHTRKKAPSGLGSKWTAGMHRVLDGIGREWEYEINRQGKNGEINHIDYCFFKKCSAPNWYPPSVVLEHENAWNVEETRKDFWKCCLYAAPLRVTIGYSSTEANALESGRELTKFFGDYSLPRISGGEVLLIYGWEQSDLRSRQWLYWLLEGDNGKWQEGRIN